MKENRQDLILPNAVLTPISFIILILLLYKFVIYLLSVNVIKTRWVSKTKKKKICLNPFKNKINVLNFQS